MPSSMTRQLPPPSEIAGHYNTLLKELKGEYIHSRWGDSEIKRRHYRQTEIAMASGLALVGASGDVLEIGCGPAVWTTLFLGSARNVSLLDISEEMLAQARVRVEGWDGGRHAGKVTYTCGDFLSVPLERARHDTVVSARAFEYMSDKPAFVRKAFDALRPGGSLLLVTKNRAWRDLVRTARNLAGVPRDQIPVGIAMQLDLVNWRDAAGMFRDAGFVDVSVHPVVIGSYDLPLFTKAPGLAFADFVHRRVYREPMSTLPRWVDALTESFLVIGRKPA